MKNGCIFSPPPWWPAIGSPSPPWGGLAGQNLPFDTTGIDFALTALFIVILLEQLRGSATPVPALAATGSSLLWLILLGPDGFLLPALLTTVAVLALLRPRLEPVLDAKEGKA